MDKPILRRAYRHFKGGIYVVLGIAEEEKTGEEVVIYNCLSTGKLFTRPLADFFAIHPKLNIPRFVEVEPK